MGPLTFRYFTIKVCHVYQVLSRPTTVSRDRRVKGGKKLYVFWTFYGKNINMDFVIVYTAPKVKHRQSIFLENTVELSKHEFILVTF